MEAIKNESDRNVIVIDSLTSAISEDASDKQVLSFFEACKRICGTGVTIIVTLHGEAIDVTLMEMVRSKCDAHLQLRSEQDGQKLVKTLQVTKVRGAQSVTGSIVGFEVEPGWGVRVIPISKARG